MNTDEAFEKSIQRLKKKIILKENENLKSKVLDDSKMIAWIKRTIEEEASCYSDQ